jgi:hypothetical protein
MSDEQVKPGIFFERIDSAGNMVKYPAWRYHALYEPRIVNNTEEDEKANAEGWKDPQVPVTAVQNFSNFYHDLEDMNQRQLVAYARDEYGIELPVEASKEKLLWALWQIACRSPKNEGRIVLLAQSIRMNYDETLSEIERLAGDMDSCQEIESEEIWL